MVDWLVEPFALGFQQRALAGGLLAALTASVVGTWLVLRGMSFFGDAFAHGVVPGIAAAIVLDVSPVLGAAVAAAFMVAAIEYVNRQTTLREDTAIGLLFVGMLALGVVIISSTSSYTGSLTAILFGDLLGVTSPDLVTQAIVAVVAIGASILLYRPLMALSFSRRKAEVLGMHPKRAHAALLILIAATIIGSYQAVGTLLIFGLLVGPPATAALLARSVRSMMLISVVIAAFSVWLGLVLSYYWGTAGSATVAVIPVVAFFITLVVTRARASWARRRDRTQVPA